MGGMVLHQGKIAEMKTGEGKTLVATLPVYLNALAGNGVHVVTVNDYLARRDAEWMGQIYRFLGLTVGVIQHDMADAERQAAYAADITYGTNNEFGFDYLRDNMKFDLAAMVQREHHFAIVDEVDSILIDEARTPLIISRPVRGVDRQVLPRSTRSSPSSMQRRGDRGERRQQVHHRRLPGRREGAHGGAHRGGRRQGREAARRRQPLRPREHGAAARRQPGAARAPPLQARRRLRGQGRRGRHRRRVHRPPDAGPPLVRRPAPGGRGQGRREDRAREPDARHDHLPELLPHVREAGRHDRHRRHRGGRVRRDLQARRRR